MKKIKHWKAILIPSLAIVATSSVAIPMACMTSKKAHVTMEFKNQRWAKIYHGQNTFKYCFHLSSPIEKSQKIVMSFRTTFADEDKCIPQFIGETKYDGNCIYCKVRIMRKDGQPLKDGDFATFYIDFKLVDEEQNLIWKDSIGYLQIKYVDEF